MVGNLIKTEAVCLDIRPWSHTSHVVTWLTPSGRITTAVKGAVRPKSMFLGQYDLNYTCEIVYYAHANGDIHAIRECIALNRREELRGDYRRLLLAEYARYLIGRLSPAGPEGAGWFKCLVATLDDLVAARPNDFPLASKMLTLELEVLSLAGLTPDLSLTNKGLQLRGERSIPVSDDVAACLRAHGYEKNLKIVVDALRVIGVFYSLHLDFMPDVRRLVLRSVQNSL